MNYEVTVGDKTYAIQLSHTETGWKCQLDGSDFPADIAVTPGNAVSVLVDGRSYEVKLEKNGSETQIAVGAERFSVTVRDPRSLRSRRQGVSSTEGVKKLVAPMPGKVIRILVPAGAAVEANQPVLVIEAMKMQNELKSPKKGTVRKLNVNEGAAVEAGQALAEVE
ncbi:MAG TPA: biotin/lipoyl-containing protein [Alphaproteobacteria bacterium]|nr:biotin/lipoyl-containing protein [Alphaproteobacteria bacterium]